MGKHASYVHLFLPACAVVLVCYLAITADQLRARVSCVLSASAPAARAHSHANRPPRRGSVSARHARALPSCAAARAGVAPQHARSYLMVFMGHSGSTALLTELHQHPAMLSGYAEPVDHAAADNSSAALAVTRRIFDQGLREGKVPGFKVRPRHILDAPDEWRALVAEYGTRIIWQYRKNIFKAAVGEYSHRYLNDRSAVEGLRKNISAEERCRLGAGCSFPIANMSFLHNTMRGMIVSQRLISRAAYELTRDSGCVREVPYEDYLYHREETLADVYRFLGLAPAPTRPLRFKATGDNMCEVVENWEEVCTNLYGCLLWQHMLEDERNGCYCGFSGLPTKYCDTFR